MLTIVRGNPCNRAMFVTKAFVTVATSVSLSGTKCTILLNLSITVSMVLYPALDLGKSTKKSMAMSCQGSYGTGSGYSRPAGLLVLTLVL